MNAMIQYQSKRYGRLAVSALVVLTVVVDSATLAASATVDLEPVRAALAAGDADGAIALLGDKPLKVPNGRGEPQFLYGEALAMQGNWAAAKKAYLAAKKKRFGEVELPLHLSETYVQLGEHADAVKLLEKVIKSKSKNKVVAARLKDALGLVYMAQGELNEAQTQFMMAELDDETNLDYTMHLGDSYYQAEVYPLAIQNYERVLGQDSSRTDVFFRIGKAYWEQRDFNKARQALNTLLTRDPSFNEGYFFLANINMLMAGSVGGDKSREFYLAALGAYNKVREVDPQADPILVAKNIAKIYYILNDFESSAVELQNAIATGASDPELRLYLGRSLQLLERFDEAVAALDEYEQARNNEDPPYVWTDADAELFRRRADCRKHLEDETQGDAILDDFLRAVELDATDPYSRSSLAYSLHTAGRYEESIPHFKFMAATQPSDGRSVFNVSLPYMKLEQQDSAIVWLEAAFEADTTAEAKYKARSAKLVYPRLIHAERIGEARPYIQFAMQDEPGNCEHAEWYAFTFYAKKQFKKALPLLERAMECYKGKKKSCSYNELRFQLGYTLYELGDKDRSYEVLTRVKECDPKNKDAQDLLDAIDATTEM